jgi:hypothetical protein
MPPGLEATLSLFADLVMAEHSVAETLRARGEDPAVLSAIIAEDERMSAADRLDIYAHMFFYRIHDVLGDYLPRTTAALGEDRFWNLLTGYLQRFPSRHPSLRYVGQDLATFVRLAEPWSSDWPWLGDLIALEWARVDVVDRADAPELTLAMAQQQGAELPSLPLVLIPAAAIVRTRFAIDETWRALGTEPPAAGSEGSALPFPEPTPTARTLLVWRKDLNVYHRVLEPDEERLMGELVQGLTFGQLCEALAASHPAEEAASAAVALASRWMTEGLLRAPSPA